MRDLKVNLIEDLEEKERKILKRVWQKPSFFKRKFKALLRVFAIFIIVAILLFSKGIFTQESVLTDLPKFSFWKGLVRMVIFQEHLLKGEISDRINILLLGMGGAEHEGAYLTDTIIFSSFKPSENKIAFLSLPRDLLVPVPGYGWQKINAAYAFGMTKEKDGGKLTSLTVNEILDLPIHYFVVIDFNGFKEIIDALGGIEIFVERSFVDSLYPGVNFSYRTISFEKGWQIMNGEKVLEFVRSRHGTNGEDSDFSRMKRQQKVLLAIKEKIEKIKILEEPTKVWRLFHLLNKYFQTNLGVDEMIKLGKLIGKVKENEIITKTLEASENSPLKVENYNGMFILTPKTGNFKEIAKIAKEIFREGPILEKSKIVLLNGTSIEGLAKSKAEMLKNEFEIVEVGNAPEKDYTKTFIYDLTGGQKKGDLNLLQEKINGEVKEEIPQELIEKNAHFIIILGKDNSLM